jgi:hypothetical protein
MGASVLVFLNGSRSFRQPVRFGVEAATLPMDLVLSQQDRRPPFGEDEGTVVGAESIVPDNAVGTFLVSVLAAASGRLDPPCGMDVRSLRPVGCFRVSGRSDGTNNHVLTDCRLLGQFLFFFFGRRDGAAGS